MLIDQHYFIHPQELIVDDVVPLLRRNTKWVNEPTITLKYRRDTLILHGKQLMWDMLDALYPKANLPRPPINDDIFHHTLKTDPARDILNDLIIEGETEYLCFFVDEGDDGYKVKAVTPNEDGTPDMTLRGIADMVDSDWKRMYPPLTYWDKAGGSTVESVVFSHALGNVTVWNLGRKVMVTGFATLPNGVDVRPRGCVLIHKQEDMFYDVMRNMVGMFITALKGAKEVIAATDSAIWDSWQPTPHMRTREADAIGHDRWLKIGGWE